MSSADELANLGTKDVDVLGSAPLSVALIGPDGEGRKALANAVDETGRATVREFDSFPPKNDDSKKLLESFDVIFLDLDRDADAAFELVEKVGASNSTAIMVYSTKADTKLAVKFMRAGAREYLLLPLEQGIVAEVLTRTASTLRQKPLPAGATLGKLLVFIGSKGGSGVTTVACNIAIAVAHQSDKSTLLIDLGLPIGDSALCLGIAADYSTEDAFRNIDRMDASLLQKLLVKHRSGVFVLAAPTNVPDKEVSKEAIEKLLAVARREFDQVIVDAGSRTDIAARTLFKEASNIFLVTQTGISELRNSNRFISQFFNDGNPKLEVVINRFESRVLDGVNDDVIAKALGRPVRWKIPNDLNAARELQYGETGLAETAISRACLEMASSITGRPALQEKRKGFVLRGFGKSIAKTNSADEDSPRASSAVPPSERIIPTVNWSTPAPITYGETLSVDQLNATASVPGSFVYTPGPGYGLRAGTHTLWVAFTPADSDGDAPLRTSASIVVEKAAPELYWPTPEEITYGTALDDTQLNASASVDGTFDYSPASGEALAAGMQTLSVTFTPTDTANYQIAQATVSISVAQARGTIEWPTLEPIRYGTPLGATQLCAAATVPGTFEYRPGFEALLAAGEHSLTAVFTPEDAADYVTLEAAASLTVTKATPEITWSTQDPITYGSALNAMQLNAIASVPGTFAYDPALGEILAAGVHELTATFTPTDTLNYTTEHAVTALTVTERLPALITWPTPDVISYGAELSSTQLNATASVPGTFDYTPSAGHVLAPGLYTLSVSFTPSDVEQYAPARASVVLEVEGLPMKPSLPTTSANDPSALTTTADYGADTNLGQETGSNQSRETRTYMGAVYEKGEDGKWHLQTN